MTYIENLSLYALLAFGIIAIPGMDMLYVMTNGLTGGRRPALAATAGIMLGGAVHTLWGALSVGMLLALSQDVLRVMLFVGAAYLAWIGMTLLRSLITIHAPEKTAHRSSLTAFRQGAVTCLLNPKAYAFMFTVFPQFIAPKFGPVWAQATAMGAITLGLQAAIYGGLGLMAARGRGHLMTRPSFTIWIGRVAGAVFIAVALATAWHGWSEL